MKIQRDRLLQLRALVDLLNERITEGTLEKAACSIRGFLSFKRPLTYFPNEVIEDDSRPGLSAPAFYKGHFLKLRLSVKEAEGIQRRLQYLLTPIAGRPPWGDDKTYESEYRNIITSWPEIQRGPQISFTLSPNRDELYKSGATTDCCAFHLFLLLEAGCGSAIGKCGYCQRYFFRERKGLMYCPNTDHASRASVSRWRRKLHNRIKESDWAKERYQKRKGKKAKKKQRRSARKPAKRINRRLLLR